MRLEKESLRPALERLKSHKVAAKKVSFNLEG